MAKDGFFQAFGYWFVTSQHEQGELKAFNTLKTEQIIDWYNKIWCYERICKLDLWRRRTETFADIGVAYRPSWMETTWPTVDYIFNKAPERQFFECFKKAKIWGVGDATVLGISRVDDVFTATIWIRKRDLEKPIRYWRSIVTKSDSSLAGDKAVNRMKAAEGSQTNGHRTKAELEERLSSDAYCSAF